MSFRAALWSTPYGWVKQGLGVSPNSGPPVGGLALMPPQGFFGDPTSALLPATAQRAHGASAIRGGFANGNWFFGSNKGNSGFINLSSGASGAKQRKPSLRELRALEKNNRAALRAQQQLRVLHQMNRRQRSFGGTHSDSLSGMVKSYPPNMRTFPMLGAYPGEVGPGILPGGTAGNGAFVGPENPLMSYYFTYGRRRSARKGARRSARKGGRRSARKGGRRSARKGGRRSARRSARRSTRRC